MSALDEAKKVTAKALAEKVLEILKSHPEAEIEDIQCQTRHYSETQWNETDQVTLKLNRQCTLTLKLSTDMEVES